MERFSSENSFLQGLAWKNLAVGWTFFMFHPAQKLFSDLYLSIFEHNLEN